MYLETIVLKNTTEETLYIRGVGIDKNSERDMTQSMSPFEMLCNQKLLAYIDDGKIIVNNGVLDMTPEQVKWYLSPCGIMSPDGTVWKNIINNEGVIETARVI